MKIKNKSIFLDEPNSVYRFFNKLNYYILGGINFNKNNTNLFVTIFIILLLIALYINLYFILKNIVKFLECHYVSSNCENNIFLYKK